PGTLTDDALLPAKADRQIAALWTARINRVERSGIAWMNLANGDFCVTECSQDMLDSELHRIAPAELLCAESKRARLDGPVAVSRRPDWHFEPDNARGVLQARFAVESLSSFDLDDVPAAVCAAGALLHYVSQTQAQALS